MAELCKSCAHTKVCMKDKNLVGDIFVPGNPMFFDNKELYKKYEERQKAGFPCDDFMSADVQPVRHGRWIDVSWCGEDYIHCSECHNGALEHERTDYCPNCGAKMDEEKHDG